MRPDLRMSIAGQDVTELLSDRLLSLSLTDQDGTESDRMSVTLDNRDYRLPLPKKNEIVHLEMGYKAAQQDDRETALAFKTGLAYMGRFVINNSRVTGHPHAISVSANAADMGAELKSARSKGWNNVLLGDVVKTVAARHELDPVIADEYAAIHFPHINQTEESDINMLTRLSRQYDLMVKPANGQLIVAEIGQGKSATGKQMPEIVLSQRHMTGFDVESAEREQYQSVVCRYYDTDKARVLLHRAGTGGPELMLREQAANAADAKRRAEAEYRRRGRALLKFSGNMPGDVRVMTGAILTLDDTWHPEHVGARFVVKSATHNIRSGYSMSFKAESAG